MSHSHNVIYVTWQYIDIALPHNIHTNTINKYHLFKGPIYHVIYMNLISSIFYVINDAKELVSYAAQQKNHPHGSCVCVLWVLWFLVHAFPHGNFATVPVKEPIGEILLKI